MSSRLESITRKRLDKLERIRARGIEPYPHRYHRSHTAQEAIALFEQQERKGDASKLSLRLAGRIVAHRAMGKATFMDIRDGSGKIQVYFRSGELGPEISLEWMGSCSAPKVERLL